MTKGCLVSHMDTKNVASTRPSLAWMVWGLVIDARFGHATWTPPPGILHISSNDDGDDQDDDHVHDGGNLEIRMEVLTRSLLNQLNR